MEDSEGAAEALRVSGAELDAAATALCGLQASGVMGQSSLATLADETELPSELREVLTEATASHGASASRRLTILEATDPAMPELVPATPLPPPPDDSMLADLLYECSVPDRKPPKAVQPSFKERLQRATPARDLAHRVDWGRLAAADASEATSDPVLGIPRQPARIEVNSGGQVFFGLLSPADDTVDLSRVLGCAEADESADWSFLLDTSSQEDGVVFKFCTSRHMLQSEQMVAELARHLGVASPTSRLLLRAYDGEEWQALETAARGLCYPLCEALQHHEALLLLQFIPGCSLHEEREAWEPRHLEASVQALGRLLVLDLLLGNADRLPLPSLGWRGNPSNVLWSSTGPAAITGRRCVPIDAVVARRPPKLLVQEADGKVGRLLELALLDAPSAFEALQEAVSCNLSAALAVSNAGADSPAVEAFQAGLRRALELVLQEQGLLEMIAGVIRSWLDDFHADMRAVAGAAAKKLSETREIQRLNRAATRQDLIRERLGSWRAVLREKSATLLRAADDWCERHSAPAVLSFAGFLGATAPDPLVDAYELLVRLQQLLARLRVLRLAADASRPLELPGSPLLLGPATSACSLHLLRRLGVTLVISATADVPAPRPEELGQEIQWRRVPLEEAEGCDLAGALAEAVRLASEATATGGRVLVHCHEGRSRSPAMCLAYAVVHERRTLAQAWAQLQALHTSARPGARLWRELLALELAVLGANSLTEAELPPSGPRNVMCSLCQQVVGLSDAALDTHMKLKHRAGPGGA